jgi:hypothetical protein
MIPLALGPEVAIAHIVDLLEKNDAFDEFLGLCNGNPRLPNKKYHELLKTWRLHLNNRTTRRGRSR